MLGSGRDGTSVGSGDGLGAPLSEGEGLDEAVTEGVGLDEAEPDEVGLGGADAVDWGAVGEDEAWDPVGEGGDWAVVASPDTVPGADAVPPVHAVPAHPLLPDVGDGPLPGSPLLGVASGARDPDRLAVMVGAETNRPGRAGV